jgi:hypothetical protein
MSNKQQTAFKLYTEEQVKKMLDLARFTYNSEDKILLSQIPIELPSDEEINDSKFSSNAPIQELYNDGWEEGAKWMRDKIRIQGR